MKMRQMVFKRRPAVAQAIGVFILMLVIVASVYIPMNLAITQYEGLTTGANPVLTGYDPSTLAFVQSYWIWLPAFIFFVGIAYVYMKAQRQS